MKNIKQSGIYCIENKINKKKYIGQAKNISKRWYEHKYKLRHNEHGNPHLQRSWNKYGEKNFKFYVIENCKKELLSEREIYWIEFYDTYLGFGYNETLGGEGYNTINPVLQFNLIGEFIAEYNNAYMASNATGCNSSQIYKTCNFKIKKPLKYIWLYKKDYNEDKTILNYYLDKVISQYTEDGDFIRKWGNVIEIQNELGIDPKPTLYHTSNTVKGFIFLFDSENIVVDEEYIKQNKEGKYHRKQYFQYSLKGDFIQAYNSTIELRKNGFHDGRVIKCCKHQIPYYKKCIWVYNDDINFINEKNCKRIKELYLQNSSSIKVILQFDLNMNLLKKWNSGRDIKNAGMSSEIVRNCCQGERKTYKNSIWLYEESVAS